MSYFLPILVRVRADRLVAIVLLLQVHGQLTAADLADRLETSERTIRRDLDALSGAGIPVYAQRGRGGGWALLGGNRIDLSGLTADEAQALFMAAGPGGIAGLGVEPGVRSALRKVLSALPAPLRDQAMAAQSAVHIDPVGWGRTADQPQHLGSPHLGSPHLGSPHLGSPHLGSPHLGSPHLDTLRDAIVAGVQVVIGYAKPRQAPADRRVDPFGLVSKGGTWYLVAGTQAGMRTFRVSRIRTAALTDTAVQRPKDFDLAEAWDAVKESFPERMSSVPVDLRIEPGALRMVTAVLGGWARLRPSQDTDAHPWPRYTASFPSAMVAAADLARFGRRVAILAPVEVQIELARIGHDLVATYGGASAPA